MNAKSANDATGLSRRSLLLGGVASAALSLYFPPLAGAGLARFAGSAVS